MDDSALVRARFGVEEQGGQDGLGLLTALNLQAERAGDTWMGCESDKFHPIQDFPGHPLRDVETVSVVPCEAKTAVPSLPPVPVAPSPAVYTTSDLSDLYQSTSGMLAAGKNILTIHPQWPSCTLLPACLYICAKN